MMDDGRFERPVTITTPLAKSIQAIEGKRRVVGQAKGVATIDRTSLAKKED